MRKLIGIALATALLAGLIASGSSAAPIATAASATSCQLSTKEQRGLGASYVTSLKVEGHDLRQGQGRHPRLQQLPHRGRQAAGHLQPQGRPLHLHREALRRRSRRPVQLQSHLHLGRQESAQHLHPEHLARCAQYSKSRSSAASTASAAIAEPASLRWMPSGSRTIVSLPSTSIASRKRSPGVKIAPMSMTRTCVAPRRGGGVDRGVDGVDDRLAVGVAGRRHGQPVDLRRAVLAVGVHHLARPVGPDRRPFRRRSRRRLRRPGPASGGPRWRR